MMMSEQEDLEFKIEEYNEFYRNGQPRISDAEYDGLIEQLRSKFPDSLLLKKSIIEKPKESRKQKLPIPMYSLNKVKSLDEIKQWLKSNDIPEDELLIITPKYDGISLVVNEANKNAWTRGDGEFGQDSKWHFNELIGVHHKFPYEGYSFGEAIMSKKNFQIYKEEFANPRNMVAGLFNRDITTTPLQHVDYIRYGCNENGSDKRHQLNSLNELNSVKVPYYLTSIPFLKEESLNQIYKLWSEDYQIDGLVIDIDSAALREGLGREENMNPKYARAYKTPEWSGTGEVKVIGVTWQVSKQGKLKPVINIEPTEVSGVTISNVTGYNAAYVFDNNIAEDSIIKIIRSGDVIPKHIETVSFDGYECTLLQDQVSVCPCCYGQTEWDETMTELVCNNPGCMDKRIAKLVHFFSTLEIEDFGEPSITSFYLNGFETPEEILSMSYHDIVRVEGFGDKTAKNLTYQFFKLMKDGVPAAKLLHALDLFDGKIGEKTIQKIFDNYENLNDLQISKLILIDGVSDITATVFISGFKRYLNEYLYLLPISYVQSPKKQSIGDKYKDEKICFTGCRPSKELEDEILSQGGEVVSGVSNKTTILVVKDMSEKTLKSNKAIKAKELNIKIVELSKL